VKEKVAQILFKCTSIVAFHGIKFDMPLILKWLEKLEPKLDRRSNGLDSKFLDFCAISKKIAISYISLNNVCILDQVQVCKSATGAQAVIWADEREWKKLREHCMQDFFVLLELTQHALENGLYFNAVNMKKRADVQASKKILVVFDDKFQHIRAYDKLLNNDPKKAPQQSLTKVYFDDVFLNK